MKNSQEQFDRLLEAFPSSVREHVRSILHTGGMLGAGPCAVALNQLKISPEEFMLKLLPLAKLYAAAHVSNFQVGAVAKARPAGSAGGFALFLGANIEFAGTALTHTIHAEQSAVINAWLKGALRIDAIASSEVPCGRCRQFLFELDGRDNLTVIVQGSKGDNFTKASLLKLLPQAFGPAQLGVPGGLMGSDPNAVNICLKAPSKDPLVTAALEAASRSYAPYTRNFAGCAIQDGTGKIHAGRCAENAAFNPSLSPLQTAIVSMYMDNQSSANTIKRAVLVEKRAAITQRGVCELLLGACAPQIRLEYFEVAETRMQT
jgi:cytidine deaminase